jgi:predicted phage-related endonuclease
MDLDGRQNADVKTVHPRAAGEWGEQGTDEIPVYYTVQFLFGQMITERDRTLCTALIGADDLRVYRTERDEDAITWLREKAIDFWEMVQTRTAPPITTIEDVNLAWPQDSGKAIQATAEIEEMIAHHKLIKRSLAGDEAKCDLLELEIFKFMGDRTEIVDGDGKRLATRRLQERKGYTVQPATFRVFRAA